MSAIRVVIGMIIAAIVVVALLPLAALLDLAGGGDGMGLCDGGLSSCRTSYFDAPELLAMLVIVLFLLLLALRAALHVRSIVEQRRDDPIGDRSARR